jgi:hypothetical protein
MTIVILPLTLLCVVITGLVTSVITVAISVAVTFVDHFSMVEL